MAAQLLRESKNNTPTEYIPAPYLVDSSFIGNDDLVRCYKDFHASLKYVTAAPELVFERLIFNVSIALGSRKHRVGQMKEIPTAFREGDETPGLATLQSTISAQGDAIAALKSELRELRCKAEREVTTSASVVVVGPSNNPEESTCQTLGAGPATGDQELKDNPISFPRIGTFKSSEGYAFTEPSDDSEPPFTYIYFYFYTTDGTPALDPPVGLTTVPLNASVDNSVGTWIYGDQASMEILGSSHPTNVVCSWLDIDSRQSEIQWGAPQRMSGSTPSIKGDEHISFTHAYDVPPQVVVWLNAFDLKASQSWSLMAYPTNITTAGFSLKFSHEYDSIGVSWVAFAAGMAGVASGSIVASSAYHPKGQGNVEFSPGTFKTPPRVTIAINEIQIASEGGNMVLAVSTSNITSTGMTWHVTGLPEKTQYQIGASYIAIASS